MAEPQRVADLVEIGLVAVAADGGAVIGQPLGRDVDMGGAGDPVRPAGIGHRAVRAVVEQDLPAARHLGEADADDVRPGGQRLPRHALAGGGKRGQVDADRTALADVEMMAAAAPVAGDQLIGDLRHGRDRRGNIGRRGQLIGAHRARIKAGDVDEIGPSGRRLERDQRIDARSAVVVLEQLRTGRIAHAQIGVAEAGAAERVERDRNRLAGRQADPEPVVVAADLDRLGDAAADGQRRGRRGIAGDIYQDLVPCPCRRSHRRTR